MRKTVAVFSSEVMFRCMECVKEGKGIPEGALSGCKFKTISDLDRDSFRKVDIATFDNEGNVVFIDNNLNVIFKTMPMNGMSGLFVLYR